MQVKIEYIWQTTAADVFQRITPAIEPEIPAMKKAIINDGWYERKDVFSVTINSYQALMKALDFGFLDKPEEVNQRMCLISHFGWFRPRINQRIAKDELIGTGILLATLLCDIKKPEFIQRIEGSEKTICPLDHLRQAELLAKMKLIQCGFDEEFATWVGFLIRNSQQPHTAFSSGSDRANRINQFINTFSSREHGKIICLSLMMLGLAQMCGSDFPRLNPGDFSNTFNAYKETFMMFSFSDGS